MKSVKKLVALWRFIVDVALRWYHGGIGDLAAGVTFWILVSLPASILALIAALGWLDNIINFSFAVEVETTVLEFVGRVFTDDSNNIENAVKALFEQQNAQLLTVSLAVTLWSISRGFAGLIRALDDIYDVEDSRTWYHTRVVAILLGFGSLLISVPLVMIERLLWERVPDGLFESTGRAVVALAVLIGWASTIYHFGPAQRSRWRHDLPGAIVAAVMWWLLTIGFGLYVSLTASANGVTAAVGAGLLGLTWLWLAAQVLLIGGAVNHLFGVRLDISRERRSWNINGRISHRTGELRKIVVANRGQTPPAGIEAIEGEAIDSETIDSETIGGETIGGDTIDSETIDRGLRSDRRRRERRSADRPAAPAPDHPLQPSDGHGSEEHASAPEAAQPGA